MSLNRREFLKSIGVGTGLSLLRPGALLTRREIQADKDEIEEPLPEIVIEASDGEENVEVLTEEPCAVPLIFTFQVDSLPNLKTGSAVVRVEFSNYHEVEKMTDLEAGDFPIESLTFYISDETIETKIVDTFEGGNYAVPIGTLSEVDPSSPFEFRIAKVKVRKGDQRVDEYKLSIQQNGFPLVIIPLSIYENGQVFTPGSVEISVGIKANKGKTATANFSKLNIELPEITG